MKNDLISRKAIKEYINQSDLTNREKMTLHIAINNIPAATAEHDVHGRWKKGLCRGEYLCSECGDVIVSDIGGSNYCRECGALMDGGEGE